MASNQDRQESRIDDPEKLSQNKRIQELLNRRRGVIDARDQAFDAVTMGQATEGEALQFYQSRIESLIIDLWTKFENSDIEEGEEYLYTEPIDTIEVPPPSELVPSDESDMAAGEDTPDPKTADITGLKWFIDNEPVIRKSFTAYTWNPPGEQTVVATKQVPAKTLDKALLKCMEFIDKTGIDADLEKEEQQTKIDRDLLEEVEEWRAENVNKE